MVQSEIKKAGRTSAAMIVVITILSMTALSAALIIVLQANHIINLFGTSTLSTPSISQSSLPVLENTGSAVNGVYKQPAPSTQSTVTITDKLQSSISLTSGAKGSDGTWVCENALKNKVIVQAAVYLNNQIIAESAPMNPGQHIQNIKLLASISPGNYYATVFLNYYDLKTQAFISKSGYRVSLSVA
jgi:hypothetical protein